MNGEASAPARYRVRNEVLIDAIEWTGSNEEAVRDFAGGHWDASMPPCFVARGVTGHLFTVEAGKFAQMYEPAATEDDPVARLLALPLPENDSGASTVRGYLTALLAELWRDPELFSGKDAVHQDTVYAAMARDGFIRSTVYDDGSLESVDDVAADALILAAIERMGQ